MREDRHPLGCHNPRISDTLVFDRLVQVGYRPAAECAGDEPGSDHPSAACAALLTGSPKAELEWRQECDFHGFEAGIPGRRP